MRALVALALLVATALAADDVEVEVRGVYVDPDVGAPVIRLVEKAGGGRELPLWVGPFEAEAIVLELHAIVLPRPMTHDLMRELIERLGGRLDRVVIEDLREGTYFARIYLTAQDGRAVAADARPSDAIALALRFHRPILVREPVLVRSAAAGLAPVAVRVWGLTVQDLTPALADGLRIHDPHGVLVADVGMDASAHGLQRGDVIVAVDGKPVESALELSRRAEGGGLVALRVHRGEQELAVRFASR